MGAEWFLARTCYRVTAEGRPQRPDRGYDPRAVLIEQRCVLIRAADAKEAEAKARKEAQDHIKRSRTRNLYEQTLVTTLVGRPLIRRLESSPHDKMELWSWSEIVDERVSEPFILRRFFALRESEAARRKRQKFKTVITGKATS